MTPGTYLRKRREAAHVSLDVIAAAISSDPHWGERDRLELLRGIEGDVTAASGFTLATLRQFYRFDGAIYDQLVDRHVFGADLPSPRLCRNCGCSQLDACIDQHRVACAWAEYDLCTQCVGVDALGQPLRRADQGLAA